MKTAIVAGLAASVSAVNARTKNWKLLGRADANARKTFSVAMPMRDFPGLEKELSEISDPLNPRYGQWLSQQEADAFTATVAPIVDEVYSWATSTGAACKKLPESLMCEGSVKSIEALLSTELSEFGHTKTGRRIIRTSKDATVPDSLIGKVMMVSGLTNFPVPRLGNSRPIEVTNALGDVDYAVVPQTLAAFYNISTWDGSSKSTQAPIEFQGYPGYVESDLAAFLTAVAAPAYTIPASRIVGAYAPGEGAESGLDEQYIGAIGRNNVNWYWTEADWLLEFGQHLSSQPADQLPAVMSISYAWYELDQCDISPGVAPCSGQPVPAGSAIFVDQVNQLFAKAGARGVSLSSASGDSGAHGRTDPSCADPHTRPDFPAASPYVTAVGATEIENGKTGAVDAPICKGTLQCATGGYEIVASNKVLAFFSSGGGFSTLTPRPTWQDTVVTSYLKNASAVPAAADFNKSNRGFPDVAALGHNFFIELGGVSSVDGTSAATPVWSGMVASLNAWRIANGKPVLGYLNPIIYAAYAVNKMAFNDVVQGDNTCTEDACPCPVNTGFYAAPGWDATTGLGTPNYGLLKAAILTLDAMREAGIRTLPTQ